MQQLPSSESVEELAQVGRLRHSVAAKLLAEAEACYDAKALWRQSSSEAVAALTVGVFLQITACGWTLMLV